MLPVDFAAWFSTLTGHAHPRPWQRSLAARSACDDCLIRIPTGLGKTEGVLATWLWHRVTRGDEAWPRRLVWCLPMRVLVEQTAASAQALVARAGGDVAVHRLLGGVEADDWHLYPERPAVLVGTQDMLLSRALNRGYAAGRGRWPIDFALLNHDALWVMDEVQLMEVGLTTSVQLQAFRAQEAAKGFRPCHTWWMSATLQPQWLETVEFTDRLPALDGQAVRIPPTERTDDLWAVKKTLRVQTLPLADDKKHEGVADVVLAAILFT